MKKIVLIGVLLLLIGICGSTADAQINGCKKYLGRTGEYLCETQTGYEECAKKLKGGSADFCLLAEKPETAIRRISVANAVDDLNRRGCLRNGNAFECSEKADYNTCLSYKNYGAVGGCSKSEPKAVKGNLYVFAIGTDGAMWTVKSTNGKWGDWQKIGGEKPGGKLEGGIDACSPNPGTIVSMFIKFGLEQATFVYSKSDLPSVLTTKRMIGSVPSVACSPGDEAWVFARGWKSSAVYYAKAEGGVWKSGYDDNTNGMFQYAGIEENVKFPPNLSSSTWYQGEFNGFSFKNFDLILKSDSLGGEIKGGPDAITVNGDPIVFVRGMDDAVWVNRRTTSGWTGFKRISDTRIASDLTAVYLPKRKAIWLFARGTDNKLWASQITDLNTLKASVWLGWSDVLLAGSPEATSWDGNRVDVVARAVDNSILHFWRDDSEALVKKPQVETVPNGKISYDPGIVGAQW